MDWTTDPRTIALLAKVRADEPKRVRKSIVYAISREDWFEYEGPVVDALNAIRDEHGRSALAKGHATEDYSDLAAWAAAGTVHELIDSTLSLPVEQAEAA